MRVGGKLASVLLLISCGPSASPETTDAGVAPHAVTRVGLAARAMKMAAPLVRDGASFVPVETSGSFRARLPERAGGLVHLEVANRTGVSLDLAAEVADVAAELRSDTLHFTDVAPSTDLVLFAGHGGFFEDLRVLHDDRAPRTLRWRATLGSAIADVRVREGRFEAVDATGYVQLATAPVVAEDAQGHAVPVHLRVARDGEARLLELRVDRGVFPIVVDPAWVSSATTFDPHLPAFMLSIGGVPHLTGGNQSIESYDEATNTWKNAGNWSVARGAAQYTAAAGGIMTAGGSTGGTYTSTAEVWAPSTGVTLLASMNVAHANAEAVTLASGKVLVAGGYIGATISIAEVYDPAADKWTVVAPLAAPRAYYRATRLTSGKVLVVGGIGSTGAYQSSCELFDPSTNTFGPAGTMKKERGAFAMAQLPTGKVVVGGGYDNMGATLSTAEVYDPATDSWSNAPAMPSNSTNPAAITVGTKVLFAGGSLGGTYATTSALFDGATWSDAGNLVASSSYGTGVVLPSGRVLLAGGTLQYSEIWDPSPNCKSDVECAAGKYCFAVSGGGICQPKLANGQGCDRKTQCTSGFCVGGLCCDRACNGACEACHASIKGSGVSGVCGNVAAGTDPYDRCPADTNPCGSDGFCDGAGACRVARSAGVACGTPSCSGGLLTTPTCNGTGACVGSAALSCAPYACNGGGTGTACLTSCSGDADCAPGVKCLSGKCSSKLDDGEACTVAAGCKSGFCVDGVCCDTSCTGGCRGCSAKAKGGGTDGVCGTVAEGTDPHDFCSADPGYPANCKGDGFCDGAGACRTQAKPGTACGDNTCTDATLVGKQCDATGVCSTAPPRSCDGYECDVAGVACTTSCTSDLDCALTHQCSFSKCVPRTTPVSVNGGVCTDDAGCLSGHCVDGVCCNTKCAGQCEACDVKDSVGTCALVKGTPHGARFACGDGICAGSCNGVDSLRCAFPPPGTTCATTCSEGTATESLCDGRGACVSSPARFCDGTTCDGDHCREGCAADTDCLGGFRCEDATCRPVREEPAESGGCTHGSSPPTGRSGLAIMLCLGVALSLRRAR